MWKTGAKEKVLRGLKIGKVDDLETFSFQTKHFLLISNNEGRVKGSVIFRSC